MSLNLDRSTWRRVKFGDVVRNVNDYFDPARDGELPYVAGPHIDSSSAMVSRWGLTSDDDFPPTFKRMFQAGDVLLHSRGVEKIASVDRSGVTGEKLFVLRATDPQQLDQRFLVWLLRSPQAATYYRANFSGSVNKFLNWTPLAAFEFDLPPLADQRRIADLLWSTEGDLASAKILIDSATQVRKVCVTDTFLTWDRACPSQTIETLFEVQLGKMLSAKTRPTDENSHPYLANINVRWRSFDLSDLRQLALTDSDLVKFQLETGDILVCEGGEIGRSAIWRGEVAPCYYQKALHRLRRRPNSMVSGEIFVEFMHWTATSGRLASFAGGTTFSHLTEVTLRSMPMPVPGEEEQRQFLAHLERIDDTVLAFEERQEALRQLKARILAEVAGS